MFKPFYTLSFLIIIFLFFLLISIIPIPDNFTIGNLILKTPKLKLSYNQNIKNQKAEKIIEQLTREKKQDEIQQEEIKDTLSLQLKDTILPVQVPIYFPENLYLFFTAITKENYIHVLHYGDSQIEGDRITNYLRQQFQLLKQSCGEGLIIPYKVNQIRQAVDIELEGKWERYAIFGNRTKKVFHNQYGPLLQFVRFAPVFNDSVRNDSIIYEATLHIKKSRLSNYRCKEFGKLKILYGNLKKPVLIQLYVNDNFLEMKSLNPTLTTQLVSLNIPQNTEKITLEFTGKDSPDIYALSFENDYGIYFDNIPMRGSSGTDFTKVSCSQLNSVYNQFNVRLIIYQFGINVAPSKLKDYTFYENWVYEQLQYIKRCYSQASILVVGISDMSLNTDSGIISLPSIAKIRDAQKKAAQRANCAFWDTYEAMGGKNSMTAWVKAGLASKDYTHFSFSGSQLIAKMLYNAIYSELLKYSHSKNQNTTSQL